MLKLHSQSLYCGSSNEICYNYAYCKVNIKFYPSEYIRPVHNPMVGPDEGINDTKDIYYKKSHLIVRNHCQVH